MKSNNSLLSNNSLKEFEEIHQKAKSVLSKGNFSFGHKFYDSDNQTESPLMKTSENDTFELEDDSDQRLETVPKFNFHHSDQKDIETHNRGRKQWGKKTKLDYDPEPQEHQNYSKWLVKDL